jgi:predicted nucleic acid-binding protein
MRWVVDASLAVKWVVPETDSPLAIDLIGESLLAPDLIPAEVAHVLWKKLVRKEVSEAVPQVAASWLVELGLETFSRFDLLKQASSLSSTLRYPADGCFYLALAKAENVPMVTADGRLQKRCRQADARAMGLQVELLGSIGSRSADLKV